MHFDLVSNNNRNPGMGVWGSVLLPNPVIQYKRIVVLLYGLG